LISVIASTVLSGCTPTRDGIPTVTVGSTRYFVHAGSSYAIEAGDLAPAGSASRADDPSSMVGVEVFALSGVSPTSALVAKSARASLGSYLLLVADSVPPASGDAFVQSIPGLCRYVPTNPCP
jgi:hypothetical protein